MGIPELRDTWRALAKEPRDVRGADRHWSRRGAQHFCGSQTASCSGVKEL